MGRQIDLTRQLPASTTSPLPIAQRWRTPTLVGIAEALARFAEACLHPLIVLPLLFATTTESDLGIGWSIAILIAASLLASVLAIPPLGAQWPRLRPSILVGLTGVTFLILLGLSRATDWLGASQNSSNRFLLFFLLIVALTTGAANTLRLTLAGVNRAEGSWRARWSRWFFIGLAGAVAGGLAARGGLTLLNNANAATYAHLFTYAGLATLVAGICLAVLLALNWQQGAPADTNRFDPFTAFELLSNNLAYNRFLFFRLLYAIGAVAEPFYILYATRELGGSGRTVAAYLVTFVFARAIAAVCWRILGIRAGNPLVLQLATFVRLLAPITALTLPPLLGSATLRDRLPGGDSTNLFAFGIVFAALGIAHAGMDLAAPTIQAALTTPRERQSAQIITGLTLALGTLALPLGGLIVDRLGYSLLFIAALLIGLGTLLAGGLLDEPGVLVVRAAPDERPVLRRRNVRREP